MGMGPWRDTLEHCMWQKVAKKRQGDGSLTPRSRVSWTMRKWVSAACGKGYGSHVQRRQSVMGIQALIGHVFVLWEISGEGWKAARQGYMEFSRDRMLVIQERCNRVRETSWMMSKGLGTTQLGRGEGEWHSRPLHSWFLWISEPLPWLNMCG